MAYDSTTNSFWFHETCPTCNHQFFYRSGNSIFKAFFDKQYFKIDFSLHKAGCINNRVEKALSGQL